MDDMPKIVIIGMGFLMDYIYPCYDRFITSGNQKDRIAATTADENGLEEKRKKYEFPIILNDNLSALRKLNPDIILFAPPPKAAPAIIEKELKVYFDELRDKGFPLPDIYAFPPSPTGDYYLNVLGNDIFVCNILPNMVKEINGISLNGKEGFNYVTYSRKLMNHNDKRQRVSAFFKPLGRTIDIPDDKVMEVLAGFVMIDLWPLRTFFVSDISGIKNHVNVVEKFLGNSRFGKYYTTINKAVFEFYIENGLNEDTAEKITSERCSLVLHEVKDTERDKLVKSIDSHATAGGVLEKGRNLHKVVIDNLTQKYFTSGNPQILEDLSKAVYNCLKVISEHGSRLSVSDITPHFNSGHHAMLWAIYVRNVNNSKLLDAKKLLQDTIVKYAMQRGERMAKRVASDNKALTMENYMSYGEWEAPSNTFDTRVLNRKPTVVTQVRKCPWCSEWNKFGYLAEGARYCEYIDKNLVRGFDKKLNLSMNSIISHGDDFCEFVWHESDYDKVEDIPSAKRIKPWIYHMAHLYYVIKERSEHIPFLMEKINKDFYTLYDINLELSLKSYENIDFTAI